MASSSSFMEEILSTKGSHVFEKMNGLVNKRIGNYLLKGFRYDRESSNLELDLLGPKGEFRFKGKVDERMFVNSDFVLCNHLGLRVQNALYNSA